MKTRSFLSFLERQYSFRHWHLADERKMERQQQEVDDWI
jgi:hypothetical protein